jgi:hypothetical protein
VSFGNVELPSRNRSTPDAVSCLQQTASLAPCVGDKLVVIRNILESLMGCLRQLSYEARPNLERNQTLTWATRVDSTSLIPLLQSPIEACCFRSRRFPASSFDLSDKPSSRTRCSSFSNGDFALLTSDSMKAFQADPSWSSELRFSRSMTRNPSVSCRRGKHW